MYRLWTNILWPKANVAKRTYLNPFVVRFFYHCRVTVATLSMINTYIRSIGLAQNILILDLDWKCCIPWRCKWCSSLLMPDVRLAISIESYKWPDYFNIRCNAIVNIFFSNAIEQVLLKLTTMKEIWWKYYTYYDASLFVSHFFFSSFYLFFLEISNLSLRFSGRNHINQWTDRVTISVTSVGVSVTRILLQFLFLGIII